MKLDRKRFRAMIGCSLFSLAIVGLALAPGCGSGVTDQVTLDDDAKARVQSAQDNMKKSFEKKKAAEATSRKKGSRN